MGTLRAGIARVCVTPPIGVELAGYGPFLHRRSETIHDDLHAEALVIDDGNTRAAIITSDLIAYDEAFVAYVRGLAAEGTGVPPENIMLSCVHSHTAPTACFLRAWGERDREYLSLLARYLAGAVSAASRSLQPVRMGYGRGEHRQLAWNRLRDPAGHGQEGPADPGVLLLRLDEGESGKPLALLINYACHAVMLGPKTAISADYPGATRRHVEAALPGCVTMFANGACGDIDPVSNQEVWGQATFEDVDRAGAALAEDVVKIAQGIVPGDGAKLRVARVVAQLPLQSMSLPEADAEVGRRQEELNRLRREGAAESGLSMARFWLLWARDVRDALRRGATSSEKRAEAQGIALGEGLFLGLPAEVFTEVGWAIKARSPFRYTFLVTYANGDVGYIPTEEDFAMGGYAATVAPAIYNEFPFTPDVGARLAEAAGQLLGDLS